VWDEVEIIGEIGGIAKIAKKSKLKTASFGSEGPSPHGHCGPEQQRSRSSRACSFHSQAALGMATVKVWLSCVRQTEQFRGRDEMVE
jgi:hypothetical protein